MSNDFQLQFLLYPACHLIQIMIQSLDNDSLEEKISKRTKSILIKLIFVIAAIACLGSIVFQKGESSLFRNQYYVNQTNRTKLEQPRTQESLMIYWRFTRERKIKEQGKFHCAVIKAGNTVTKHAINSAIHMLNDHSFGAVYLVMDGADMNGKKLIKQTLISYYKVSQAINFNSDFTFGKMIRSQCSKLAYIFGNFQINKQMATRIKDQITNLQPLSLYFTSSFQKSNEIVKASDLRNQDLSIIDPLSFYSYLYIFDPQITGIFAPVNFGYYGKYTFEEIMLIPTLIFYQSLGKMKTNDKILHRMDNSFLHNKQFALESLRKQQKSICIVSYPKDPYKIDRNDAIQYLNSVQSQDLIIKNAINATIVVYLPYIYEDVKEFSIIGIWLYELSKRSPGIRFKLKIMPNKVSPSHAVYQSVYSFCPNHALVVNSRHNVRFHKNMVTEVLNWQSTRYHYYFFNYVDSKGQKHDLDGLDYNYEFISKKGSIFEDKLRHIQVFKSDLMKMVPFWILKSAEIDFYETEAPFVINMIQTIRSFGIKCIQESLATVLDRPLLQKQKEQIQNIRHYSIYSPMYVNVLMPYGFNCLENPVFRKNAPFKIPAIIHQIWLSKTSQISGVRKALHDTLVRANLKFEIQLWKNSDLTYSNFPLTYNLITTVLEKNKESKRSLFAMAADLMRYEILLQRGGIYIDFKWQGNRPLDNFLKYESFFIDFDIEDIRFGRPKALGNGFMGAIPNNYHLKMVLTELLNENTLHFAPTISYITGGWIVRNAISDYQIFTQMTLGYHLTVPKAYEKTQNFCRGANQDHYDADQTIYEIKRGGKTFKFPIPCKLYPESYGVIFSPLAGTWATQNAQIN